VGAGREGFSHGLFHLGQPCPGGLQRISIRVGTIEARISILEFGLGQYTPSRPASILRFAVGSRCHRIALIGSGDHTHHCASGDHYQFTNRGDGEDGRDTWGKGDPVRSWSAQLTPIGEYLSFRTKRDIADLSL
jgi:hypothetical protein